MYEVVPTRIGGLRQASGIPSSIRSLYTAILDLAALKATYLNFPGNPSPTTEETDIYQYMHGLFVDTFASTDAIPDLFDAIDDLVAGVAGWDVDHADLLALTEA